MRFISSITGVLIATQPLLASACAATPTRIEGPDTTESYAALLALHGELRDYMVPAFTSSVVLDSGARVGEQYAEPLMQAKIAGLAKFEQRLAAMNVATWPRDQQVEWLATKSILNGYRFNLEVLRPWRRDPGFYLDPLMGVAFSEPSADLEQRELLRSHLRAIPPMLTAAKGNLSEVPVDFADLALFNLENSDGVNHYHPYRAVPPAGIIGWFDDLLSRARAGQPEIALEVAEARKAVVDFRDWLRSQRPSMTGSAGVGPSRFQWYMTHVRMVPYTTAEMMTLAQREHDRLWAAYALTRHRNRNLADLALSGSAAEQAAKVSITDQRVREFLLRENIVTVPSFVGDLGSNTPWIARSSGPNFWEQIQFRDPIPDHLHAVIPGHRFDAELAKRDTRPIRGAFSDGVRAEGWATYLEEAMMIAGAPVGPRAQEFIQLFGIFRAVRVPADIHMQHNRWSVSEAVVSMRENTPWLDQDVARVDAEIYLRRPPGYGLAYTIGKVQMDALLAELAAKQGAAFSLLEFHDQFLAAGRLPISLIRYEMTGQEREVSQFWSTPPIPSAN
jgi:hypothetical protein